MRVSSKANVYNTLQKAVQTLTDQVDELLLEDDFMDDPILAEVMIHLDITQNLLLRASDKDEFEEDDEE